MPSRKREKQPRREVSAKPSVSGKREILAGLDPDMPPAVQRKVPRSLIVEKVVAVARAFDTEKFKQLAAIDATLVHQAGHAASPSLAMEMVVSKAIEVIGDRDQAMRWLGTPVRALDYATPISLLGTSEGAKRVENVLGRMEHGVW